MHALFDIVNCMKGAYKNTDKIFTLTFPTVKRKIYVLREGDNIGVYLYRWSYSDQEPCKTQKAIDCIEVNGDIINGEYQDLSNTAFTILDNFGLLQYPIPNKRGRK